MTVGDPDARLDRKHGAGAAVVARSAAFVAGAAAALIGCLAILFDCDYAGVDSAEAAVIGLLSASSSSVALAVLQPFSYFGRSRVGAIVAIVAIVVAGAYAAGVYVVVDASGYGCPS